VAKLDTTIQVRARRLDVAEAYLFLTDNGYYPRSMSEIIRLVFENSLAELVPNRRVESTSEAIAILQHFKASGNPKGRGFKALSENVLAEERQYEAEYEPPVLPTNEELHKQDLIDMQDKIRKQQKVHTPDLSALSGQVVKEKEEE